MAMAHLLINCYSGLENQVITELKKFDSVQEVKEVYGFFDIIAKLESPNLQELEDNISEDIRKTKNIISVIKLLDSGNFS